jgi:hypothetical protein
VLPHYITLKPVQNACFGTQKVKLKVKAKFTLEQATKAQRERERERVYMYSCTLSLASALDRVGGQRNAPAALPPEKTRNSLCRGWVGPRTGLDDSIKSRPTGFERFGMYLT